MQQEGWNQILEKAIEAASQRGQTMGDELGNS
jgi:pyrroline-5-carboxylate reductase